MLTKYMYSIGDLKRGETSIAIGGQHSLELELVQTRMKKARKNARKNIISDTINNTYRT